jgi:GNAT superfamily N-acetyltransferase
MKIVIRPAQPSDAEAIAHVHIATWRTTYTGIMPAEHLAKLSYEKRAAGWRSILSDPDNPAFTLVAMSDEEIVGFATGGPARGEHCLYKGELWGIYVLRDRQRQGIGRHLTLAVVEELQRRGIHSMLVWVLKDNPCRAFYEQLGGAPVGEKEIEIGGKKLIEASYGWSDLCMLVATCGR